MSAWNLSVEATVVLPERFELSTSPLPRECSTPELRQRLSTNARGIKAIAAPRKPDLDGRLWLG